MFVLIISRPSVAGAVLQSPLAVVRVAVMIRKNYLFVYLVVVFAVLVAVVV